MYKAAKANSSDACLRTSAIIGFTGLRLPRASYAVPQAVVQRIRVRAMEVQAVRAAGQVGLLSTYATRNACAASSTLYPDAFVPAALSRTVGCIIVQKKKKKKTERRRKKTQAWRRLILHFMKRFAGHNAMYRAVMHE